jgi:hypothetical protein
MPCDDDEVKGNAGSPCELACSWEVQSLIGLSPSLAYAVASGLPLLTYPFTITANFTADGAAPPILAQTPSDDPLNRDFVIEEIDVDIQTPNFNTASEFKPQADIFFDSTSGIQTTIKRRGIYGQVYNQIPLKAIPKMVSRKRPMPLLRDQKLLMDFFVTTPLATGGATNITVTFLARTAPHDSIWSLDINKTFERLDKLGYNTCWARRTFASAT